MFRVQLYAKKILKTRHLLTYLKTYFVFQTQSNQSPSIQTNSIVFFFPTPCNISTPRNFVIASNSGSYFSPVCYRHPSRHQKLQYFQIFKHYFRNSSVQWNADWGWLCIGTTNEKFLALKLNIEINERKIKSYC